MADFRSLLHNLAPEETAWCDDACLVRYLRARNWQLGPAHKLLRNSLEWRRTFRPMDIDPVSLDAEASSGKLYVHGFDRHGHPVMYQKPRRQNTKDYPSQVR